MELNSKSVFARFYLYCFGNDELPSDFCAFFWGLIWRGIGVFLLGLFFGGALTWALIGIWTFVRAHKAGSLSFSEFVLIFALMMWLVKSETLIEAHKILSAKVDSVKNRYCPRITWK